MTIAGGLSLRSEYYNMRHIHTYIHIHTHTHTYTHIHTHTYIYTHAHISVITVSSHKTLPDHSIKQHNNKEHCKLTVREFNEIFSV